MFAMDGPIASSRAWAGTLRRTQSPACWPPLTPPVPARKLTDVDGSMWLQVDRPMLTTLAAASIAIAAHGAQRRPEMCRACGILESHRALDSHPGREKISGWA